MKRIKNLRKLLRLWLISIIVAVALQDVPQSVEPLPQSRGNFLPGTLIASIVNYILGFGAALTVLFIIIGAILYIVSGGDEKSVGRAQRIILNSIIGLVIIIISFVIVRFVQTNTPVIIPPGR
ncbi:MAG: hypothetical protein M1355_03770 [Patescibacteria group bacterium]|nr:hypothetical protein [Patescibacteria group bacterium]